jgi:hypothetical protein
MQRILIISCSQSKSRSEGMIPAIDRYDGPAFRVLRKYLREIPDPSLKVLILSAKYGLIQSSCPIPYYNRRLTRSGALAMKPDVEEKARQLMDLTRWSEIGLCAGRDYLVALEALVSCRPKDVRLDLIGDGLGIRLTRLKEWLRKSSMIEDFAVVGRSDVRLGSGTTLSPEGRGHYKGAL